jgi:hypothetical protein
MAAEDAPAYATAVIDRVEGDMAVLLVGTAQRPIDVPINRLPPDTQAGQWLRVQLDGDRVVHVDVDLDATGAARQRIQEKLARLRQCHVRF